jgi:TolB protein
VQWFERARFELHPEQSPPYHVLLGLLGKEGHETARTPLQLAVSGRIDGNTDIYLLNTDGSDPVRLTTHPESDSSPVWSPDGTRIAFQSYRNGGAYTDIYMMDADGSNLLQLTDNPYWDGGSTWSPDGTRIAFTSNRRAGEHGVYLYIMNADGADLVRLADDLGEVSSPAWSPDGSRIAFQDGNLSNGVVYVINADGSGLQRLAEGVSPRWSPDSTRLAFHTPLPFDLTNTLVIINADGSNLRPIITAQGISAAAWSPDGTQLVFSKKTVRTNSDIFTVNVDGSGLQQLTHTPDRNDFYPTWSPDGTQIAFTSKVPGEFSFPQIYLMNADGSQPRRLMAGSSLAWRPLP